MLDLVSKNKITLRLLFLNVQVWPAVFVIIQGFLTFFTNCKAVTNYISSWMKATLVYMMENQRSWIEIRMTKKLG